MIKRLLKILSMIFLSKLPHHRMLFICNMKESSSYGYHRMFSGLFNSSRMLTEMLGKEKNIETKIVRVIDSNFINAEIHAFKPTIVVLEALWVPTYKLKELQAKYPNMKWIVRMHSEVPFLAHEGNAIRLLREYAEIPKVYLAANSERAQKDLCLPGPALPNYYPTEDFAGYKPRKSDGLEIGLFGSIRPMKNQLLQAISAIKFADYMRVPLHLHMNTTRMEQGGESVLKNIRALFEGTEHKLVEHEWMEPSDFKRLLKRMHMVMQVSFSETFNIVSADAAEVGIPMVTSSEVNWVENECWAEPTCGRDILNTMFHVWGNRKRLVYRNFYNLKNYSENARRIWLKFLS